MTASRLRPRQAGDSMAERPPHRLSLAHKLSILTGSVITLCLVVVLGAAYEVLTRSALGGMQARLDTATRQLAGLVQEGMRQTNPRYALLARDSATRRALMVPVGDTSPAARRALDRVH